MSLFYVINDVEVGKVRSLSAKIFVPDALQGECSERFFRALSLRVVGKEKQTDEKGGEKWL